MRALTAIALSATVATLLSLWRRRALRVTDQEFAVRSPADANGIVAGAAPIRLMGTNGRSLLLLHGSGDTPQSLRYLSERLHDAGYSVYVPLLPGHGRSPRAFRRVSARAYLEAARGALTQVRSAGVWTAVGGLSMGGALAVQLAAESSDIGALVMLAPYLTPPPMVQRAALLSWGWGLVLPYVAGKGERSIHDAAAAAEGLAYGVFPPQALRAMVGIAAMARRALPRVTAPTIVINSQEDNRIPSALAAEALLTLRAPGERHWVTGCGHVITVDYCKGAVADLVLAFLARQAL